MRFIKYKGETDYLLQDYQLTEQQMDNFIKTGLDQEIVDNIISGLATNPTINDTEIIIEQYSRYIYIFFHNVNMCIRCYTPGGVL